MGNAVVHFEIMGTDGPALQKFYADLFGWHVQNMPEMNYGVVDTHAGEGINGGIGQAPDGGLLVTFYAEADDLQAVLDRTVSLGGKVALPVNEIPGVVTLCQFLDPQGNRIGVVKNDPEMEGPGVSPGNNPPVSWFEILGPDGKTLRAFYAKLFDWHMKVAPDATIDYAEIDAQAGKGINGGVGASPTGEPMTTVYAKVDDLNAYLEKAEKLGGKTVVQPMDVGETVSIAQFADPQGNIFGLYKDRT